MSHESPSGMDLWGNPLAEPSESPAPAKAHRPTKPVPALPGATKATEKLEPVNPLVLRYGADPAGNKCGTCAYQFDVKYANTYHKCGLRGMTGGTGTDHRVRFIACARYVSRNARLAGTVGHRLPEGWTKSLRLPAVETGRNTYRCKHCGHILSFKLKETVYGLPVDSHIWEDEARCPRIHCGVCAERLADAPAVESGTPDPARCSICQQRYCAKHLTPCRGCGKPLCDGDAIHVPGWGLNGWRGCRECYVKGKRTMSAQPTQEGSDEQR